MERSPMRMTRTLLKRKAKPAELTEESTVNFSISKAKLREFEIPQTKTRRQTRSSGCASIADTSQPIDTLGWSVTDIDRLTEIVNDDHTTSALIISLKMQTKSVAEVQAMLNNLKRHASYERLNEQIEWQTLISVVLSRMGLRDMSRAAFNLALHDISKRTKHPVLWTYIYNLFADEQKAAADAVDLPKEYRDILVEIFQTIEKQTTNNAHNTENYIQHMNESANAIERRLRAGDEPFENAETTSYHQSLDPLRMSDDLGDLLSKRK